MDICVKHTSLSSKKVFIVNEPKFGLIQSLENVFKFFFQLLETVGVAKNVQSICLLWLLVYNAIKLVPFFY